jgi:excreted virulence factor EspC (type VII ESX diderm)
VSGFQTSDEMAGVASKVNAEVGPIGDEARTIGRSHVQAGDAGPDFADRGTAYLNALQHNVVASVRAFGTATTTLADKLTDTYQRYSGTESHNSGKLGSSGSGS